MRFFFTLLLILSVFWIRALAQFPGPSMVTVTGDTFLMGNSQDAEGLQDELPRHDVQVSTFAIGNAPVTWGEWNAVMNWSGLAGAGYTDLPALDQNHKTDDYPVTGVSWYDAVKWCNARSEKEGRAPVYHLSATFNSGNVYRTGKVELHAGWVDWSADGYRLPTEAEWEFAARTAYPNTGYRFPWGATITQTQANYVRASFPYDSTSNKSTPWTHPAWSPAYDANATTPPTAGGSVPYRPYTSPVGSFTGSGPGGQLYDMVGNVWQWCWDIYANDHYASLVAGVPQDPRGPLVNTDGNDDTIDNRVLRGGSWDSTAFYLRVSNRARDYPARKLHGFRVVYKP